MICIHYILPFIMFFFFQLDSWGGIPLFLIFSKKIPGMKMLRKIKGIQELGGIESLNWNTFDIVYTHAKVNQTTSLWVENFSKSMLSMHGLQQSRPVWISLNTISQRLEQKHIRDWQIHWLWIQMLMRKMLVNS